MEIDDKANTETEKWEKFGFPKKDEEDSALGIVRCESVKDIE